MARGLEGHSRLICGCVHQPVVPVQPAVVYFVSVRYMYKILYQVQEIHDACGMRRLDESFSNIKLYSTIP